MLQRLDFGTANGRIRSLLMAGSACFALEERPDG
jgi:hypothetical protein